MPVVKKCDNSNFKLSKSVQALKGAVSKQIANKLSKSLDKKRRSKKGGSKKSKKSKRSKKSKQAV